jgi:hypothetical protein
MGKFMTEPSRLQPIEIIEGLLRALEAWEGFSNDRSFIEAMMRDGRELGPLNSELGQANVAWSMSYILDDLARRPNIMNALRQPPAEIPADEFFFLHANALTSNSVIYRTYVSVVLGRTDKFVSAISQISTRNPGAQFSSVLKLLRNDEVRLLRNAIGHGTFLASGQVLAYEDRGRHRRISFRELDRLNGAIWSIVLAGWSASHSWLPQ